MASTTIRPGATAGRASTATSSGWARSPTTTAPTGARPGRCFPGTVAYVWHAGRHASTVQESLEGGRLRHPRADHLGQGPVRAQPRPLSLAARTLLVRGPQGPAHWTGDRKQSTLWHIPAREDTGFGHGTQKPVECMKRPIENNSSPGQAVYEPFCGSGTTIIAAEITGRSCHAIELMPQYVDVAVERWQAFTGEQRRRWKAMAARSRRSRPNGGRPRAGG